MQIFSQHYFLTVRIIFSHFNICDKITQQIVTVGKYQFIFNQWSRMKCRSLSVVILALLACVAFVRGQQDSCNFDSDCKDKGDDRCCSAYGFCGVGPDYCKLGNLVRLIMLVVSDIFNSALY